MIYICHNNNYVGHHAMLMYTLYKHLAYKNKLEGESYSFTIKSTAQISNYFRIVVFVLNIYNLIKKGILSRFHYVPTTSSLKLENFTISYFYLYLLMGL